MKTLYASRPLANAAEVIAWAKDQGFRTTLLPDDMHVTLCYSKKPMEWPEAIATELVIPHKAKPDVRSVKQFGQGAVVLAFENAQLSARAKALRETGATSDFPEFSAHVTLTYDPGNVAPDQVEPYAGRLVFGPERFKEIEANWEAGRVEKQFQLTATICKTDAPQRLVFGFFSVAKIDGANVKDGERDEIESSDLEKAAYAHVLDARIAGENHVRKGIGRLVESFYFSPEKLGAMTKALAEQGIVAKIDVPAEGWWGGYKIDDDAVWKKVESGDYPAFSIGGTATRED